MKKIITFIAIVLFTQLSFAQVPNAIPYQGVARNASGALLASQSISLRFSLHDVSATGTILYRESHMITTTPLGLFTVNIGNGAPSLGSMATIDWTNGTKFLQVELDASGGTAYVDMGTTQMLSVPFALYAKIAGPTPGAVIYKGTWDAVANVPHLTSSVGTKGDMYIVSNASPNPALNTNLNGISNYNVGDCVIFEGSIYQALRTASPPVRADGVAFVPNGDIISTNVQAALEEVRNDTDTKLAAKLNLSGGTMTGNLILDANPTTTLGAATKQYVDTADSSLQTQVSGKVNKAGDTMTGNLVLNADPTLSLGAATKQYVDTADSSLQTQVSGKVNRAGDTMTGDLILHSAPSTALGAATKQYVDDSLAPVQGQFDNLIDSYIHRTDDGVSIYQAPGETLKRFGIGDTAPTAPLGVAAQGSSQRTLVLKPNVLSTGGPYSFSLSAAGQPGLNIESDASTGSISRLFIQENSGFVGVGSVDPKQKLHIQSSTTGGSVGIQIQNSATTKNRAWLQSHFETGDIPTQDGRFAISEIPISGTTTASPPQERFTILSGGNVGINELTPDTKLHVSRPLADPNSDISLLPGTGIVTIGPIENNVVADYRGIQARQGSYVDPTTPMQVSTLNLQRLGGDILIHGDSTFSDSAKSILTNDGKFGLGTLTPSEKIEINGAIKIGTSDNTLEGTIRYTGTDFEGRKGGNWVSLTGASSGTNVLTVQNGGVPTVPPASITTGGVQVYSTALPPDGVSPPYSVIHVMNGNGEIIKLYKQNAISPPNTAAPNSGDASTDALIINMRNRIDQLEAVLQKLGLLTD